MNKIKWRDKDFDGALAHLPYCLYKHPPTRDILDICLTTFSDSVISKIKKLRGSFFFFKMFRI